MWYSAGKCRAIYGGPRTKSRRNRRVRRFATAISARRRSIAAVKRIGNTQSYAQLYAGECCVARYVFARVTGRRVVVFMVLWLRRRGADSGNARGSRGPCQRSGVACDVREKFGTVRKRVSRVATILLSQRPDSAVKNRHPTQCAPRVFFGSVSAGRGVDARNASVSVVMSMAPQSAGCTPSYRCRRADERRCVRTSVTSCFVMSGVSGSAPTTSASVNGHGPQ